MNGSGNVHWNMTSTNSTEEWRDSIEVKSLPLTVVFVMSVFVTASNLLVLVILLCKPGIRKNYRIEFILWLCLSDIVVGITGWLFVFNYIIKDLSTNTHYCSLMYHFIGAGIGQSIAHTFLICIDRYMAVVNNIKYKQFNKKYRYMVIFGTWFFIHGYVGILVVICMRVKSITYCSLESFPRYKTFVNGTNALYMPLLVSIPCLYIYVLIVFKKRLRQTHNCPHVPLYVVGTATTSEIQVNRGQRKQRIQKYEEHVIVTTGLIVVTFLLLTGPFILIVSFLYGFGLMSVNRSTRILITILTFCNSTVNPFLYVWRIRKFRLVLYKIFCPCKTPRTT
ncbi:adenosine receptor A2a-like [Pecten maximus]|uniref:adenosine receptor A2a-like n=1 Tax=Pecten maximus TaxID=6579 RepID=UPI001458AC16|nr:adenosine receptor A2a-like [Pecten maximus]